MDAPAPDSPTPSPTAPVPGAPTTTTTPAPKPTTTTPAPQPTTPAPKPTTTTPAPQPTTPAPKPTTTTPAPQPTTPAPKPTTTTPAPQPTTTTPAPKPTTTAPPTTPHKNKCKYPTVNGSAEGLLWKNKDPAGVACDPTGKKVPTGTVCQVKENSVLGYKCTIAIDGSLVELSDYTDDPCQDDGTFKLTMFTCEKAAPTEKPTTPAVPTGPPTTPGPVPTNPPTTPGPVPTNPPTTPAPAPTTPRPAEGCQVPPSPEGSKWTDEGKVDQWIPGSYVPDQESSTLTVLDGFQCAVANGAPVNAGSTILEKCSTDTITPDVATVACHATVKPSKAPTKAPTLPPILPNNCRVPGAPAAPAAAGIWHGTDSGKCEATTNPTDPSVVCSKFDQPDKCDDNPKNCVWVPDAACVADLGVPANTKCWFKVNLDWNCTGPDHPTDKCMGKESADDAACASYLAEGKCSGDAKCEWQPSSSNNYGPGDDDGPFVCLGDSDQFDNNIECTSSTPGPGPVPTVSPTVPTSSPNSAPTLAPINPDQCRVTVIPAAAGEWLGEPGKCSAKEDADKDFCEAQKTFESCDQTKCEWAEAGEPCSSGLGVSKGTKCFFQIKDNWECTGPPHGADNDTNWGPKTTDGPFECKSAEAHDKESRFDYDISCTSTTPTPTLGPTFAPIPKNKCRVPAQPADAGTWVSPPDNPDKTPCDPDPTKPVKPGTTCYFKVADADWSCSGPPHPAGSDNTEYSGGEVDGPFVCTPGDAGTQSAFLPELSCHSNTTAPTPSPITPTPPPEPKRPCTVFAMPVDDDPDRIGASMAEYLTALTPECQYKTANETTTVTNGFRCKWTTMENYECAFFAPAGVDGQDPVDLLCDDGAWKVPGFDNAISNETDLKNVLNCHFDKDPGGQAAKGDLSCYVRNKNVPYAAPQCKDMDNQIYVANNSTCSVECIKDYELGDPTQDTLTCVNGQFDTKGLNITCNAIPGPGPDGTIGAGAYVAIIGGSLVVLIAAYWFCCRKPEEDENESTQRLINEGKNTGQTEPNKDWL